MIRTGQTRQNVSSYAFIRREKEEMWTPTETECLSVCLYVLRSQCRAFQFFTLLTDLDKAVYGRQFENIDFYLHRRIFWRYIARISADLPAIMIKLFLGVSSVSPGEYRVTSLK
jgi:hypothetical protein